MRSIDLVTEIRNARASAKLPAADWLETFVFVPIGLGSTLRGAPTGDRAAGPRASAAPRADAGGARRRRAGRATSRSSSRGGEIEAAIRPATEREDAGALERARLERELAEAEGWLAAARDRLANEAFVSKAPPAVVDGARAREAELADQVERLRDRLGGVERAGGGDDPPVRTHRVGSALHGAARDAADEVALQPEEHGQRQRHRDEGRGSQELPAAAERVDEVRDRRRSTAGSAGSSRGRPGRPAGRSRRTGTGRSTSAAIAGTLIGSASRRNDVTGLAPSIDGRLEDLLGQAAHEVAQQEDRERQPVRRVREPDGQERAGDAEPFGPNS